MEEKKTVFSGIQPSGKLTIANYIGAVKNWVPLQEENRCLFCVVDLHSITVRQDPAKLRAQTVEALAQVMACGIDPEKYPDSLLYLQSHVSAHPELAWVLSCYAMFGELSRMTQFKDKSAKHAENINAGLFTYPVLMASDILLYQTDIVPVGDDQKQHVELCRDIATRFNGVYGDVFKIPTPVIPKVGARIMSLAEPEKKMSKSDPNENAYILLDDTPDAIMRKFKRAVTDSEARVAASPDKPGVTNLMQIYSVATGKTMADRAGHGDFKVAVAEAVIAMLEPIRTRKEYLMKNKDYIAKITDDGAEKAAYLANRTLAKVYKKVGFVKF